MSTRPPLKLLQRIRTRTGKYGLIVRNGEHLAIAFRDSVSGTWNSALNSVYPESQIVAIFNEPHPSVFFNEGLDFNLGDPIWEEETTTDRKIRELEETIAQAQKQIQDLKRK